MKKRNWLQILASYTGTCRGKIALSVLFAVMAIIGGFVPYYAVYQLIRFFIHADQQADGGTFVMFWCVAAAAGYVGKTVFNSVSTTFSHKAAFTILEELRLAIAGRLEKAPLGTAAARSTGSYKDIILDRVEEIEKPLAHLIPEFSSNLLLPVVVFIWMLTIHPALGLSLLIAPALSMLPMHKLMKDYNRQYAQYMAANHQVNSVIVEYVEGIEVIKAFNQSTQSYEKYASTVKNFKDFTLSWFRSTWKDMNLAFAIMPTTLLGVLPVGLILFRMGSATPDQLAIAFILSLSIITPLQKLSTFVDGSKPMEYAVLAADELLTMEEMPEGDLPVPEGDRTIELKDVSFSYHSGETPDVLRHVSLTVPQGSFTALVGPSGGGKSTIARLIARLWDPREGEVLFGGTNIRRIRYQELSSRISYVTQDNFLFRGTLLDNIRLGRPDASEEEVLAAARMARCDTFISRLAKGYDTPAGEAGKCLSGGEKQRIAIARAILKDAPVIIMDEATAFTDPENEYYIQQSLRALLRRDSGQGAKTLIVIAHRLSTIRHADQILLVDQGEITDRGTHEELLERSDLYRQMWSAHTGARSWSVGGQMRTDPDTGRNEVAL